MTSRVLLPMLTLAGAGYASNSTRGNSGVP
jgi:hypothetical protein